MSTPNAEQPTTTEAPPVPLGPDSVAWRYFGDRRLVLGAGRALFLQNLHPAIGAAVEQYSTYPTDPWGRLDRTVDSLLTQVYGGPAAIAEAQRLRELHKNIKGLDHKGRRYSALNPEAYAWVHLSIFENLLAVHATFGRPLSPDKQQRLYAEWHQVGRLLGLREHHMPADLPAFWDYYQDMLVNGLEDNPGARNLLNYFTSDAVPPPPSWLPPEAAWLPARWAVGQVMTLTTVGTISPVLRERLELKWTPADEASLRLLAAHVRAATPRLPRRLRYYPIAWQAIQDAQQTRAQAS